MQEVITNAQTGEITVRDLTPEEIAARNSPAVLDAWRDTAEMDKGSFCIGLWRLGALPKNEAKAAAKGDWPATFAAALASLPAGIDPDEAEIIWSATTRVRRMHPILLALIPMSNLTEADVDTMFGYSSA